MTPVEVDDDGNTLGVPVGMFEFYQDIGTANVAATAMKVHANWKHWFGQQKYHKESFTGLTMHGLCGNEITASATGKLHVQKENWRKVIEEEAPRCAADFAEVREGHRWVLGMGQ